MRDIASITHVDMPGKFSRVTVFTGAFDHIFDHLDQSQVHTIIGVVDTINAIVFKCFNLVQRDGAATTTKDLYMPCPAFP